jgi:hypothetical protein
VTAGSTRKPGSTTNAPRSVEEALAQAGTHARNAVSESLLAARSLVDAVSLALTGEAADAGASREARLPAALAALAQAIERLAQRARGADASLPGSLAEALIEALESEIERWEERSASDPDARAVLRAFLGLREILWELGVRQGDETQDEDMRDEEPSASASALDETDTGRGADDPLATQQTRDRSEDPPSNPRVRRIQVDG